MTPISYARHRVPPAIIQHTVWLYLPFTLSYRDIKDLLAGRGLDISMKPSVAGSPSSARRLRGSFGVGDRVRPAAGTWTKWS